MTKTIQSTIDPDASLYADIALVREIWDESLLYDIKPGATDYAVAEAHGRRLSDRACELEWNIARRPVLTAAGFAAKVAFINGVGFDAEVLIEVAFQLGREAMALGITDAPTLRTAEDLSRSVGTAIAACFVAAIRSQRARPSGAGLLSFKGPPRAGLQE
jgi:PIN domain nuclease of toxin-antitoxin system